MNICLLNDSFPPVIDGVANVVLNYGRILQTEGLANVLVGTPKYPDTDYSEYPYKVVPYSSFDTTKIVKGYRAGNPIDIHEIKEMAEFKPDLIHTHCPVASTYVARQLRSRIDAPIVFTYHTKFDEDIARAVKNEILQKQVAKIMVNNMEACDEVWVVSEGAGENMKSLGYEGGYRVMSNGVDFAKGRVPQDDVIKVTSGYDLPDGVPVYLFVGRLIEYKGIPYIIDALKRLKEAGENFRMVFVGSGPDADKFKAQCEELNLMGEGCDKDTGMCMFTGPIYNRDELRAWNTRADLFLFPSTYDTNGIVVREAAACGLASVLIEGSCAAEGITHGRNGYMIEQSGEAMAALLATLNKDLNRVHEVGQHAMDEIYISWEDSVHRAHERYGEIIELRASGLIKLNKSSVTEIYGYLRDMPKDMWDELERDTRRIVHAPSRLYDNMMDNVEEFKLNMERGYGEFKSSMEQGYGEFKSNVERNVDEIHDKLHNMKEDIKAEIKSLK